MATNRLPWPSMAASLLLWFCQSAIANDCVSDWLPLHTGNYWVYRTDSRFATAQHLTIRVLGPYEFDQKVYCQIEHPSQNYLLRVDAQGRIFRRSFSSPTDDLLLDPANLTPTAITSPLGFTAPAISNETSLTLLRESSTYAKAIGLVASRTTLLGGSNGGFASGQVLIEAQIDGKLYRETSTPSLTLDLSPDFRNCAVPCYYAACGLGSPVDQPNTFKPCLEARLQATQLPTGSSLALSISSTEGILRHQQQIPLNQPNPVLYRSLPFYDQSSVGQPVRLFPAGSYLITLTALDPDGKPLATTTRFAQQ
jgi:hypothetical protein